MYLYNTIDIDIYLFLQISSFNYSWDKSNKLAYNSQISSLDVRFSECNKLVHLWGQAKSNTQQSTINIFIKFVYTKRIG